MFFLTHVMSVTPLYREGREDTKKKDGFCGTNTESGLEPRHPSQDPNLPLQSLWFGGLLISESAPNTCCPQPCFSGTLASAGHTGQGVLALVDLDF